MKNPLRILVVGCGHMGTSHARAYHTLESCQIVGIVARSAEKRHALAVELGGVPEYDEYFTAFARTKPDAVCIATYPDTHASYALHALENNAHVFVEKPIASTVAEAETVIDAAKKANKKVVVGYILRQHPSWIKFIELAKTLGKPLVMRMNLNQQSFGENWQTHRRIMNSVSPFVDCGVHYVDVMCQMSRAKPVSVYAISAHLSHEVPDQIDNYG